MVTDRSRRRVVAGALTSLSNIRDFGLSYMTGKKGPTMAVGCCMALRRVTEQQQEWEKSCKIIPLLPLPPGPLIAG